MNAEKLLVGYIVFKIKIVWGERVWPLTTVLFAGAFINQMSGIAKLTLSKRLAIFVVMGFASELLVRIKKSDIIFYSLP